MVHVNDRSIDWPAIDRSGRVYMHDCQVDIVEGAHRDKNRRSVTWTTQRQRRSRERGTTSFGAPNTATPAALVALATETDNWARGVAAARCEMLHSIIQLPLPLHRRRSIRFLRASILVQPSPCPFRVQHNKSKSKLYFVLSASLNSYFYLISNYSYFYFYFILIYFLIKFNFNIISI